MKPKITVFNDHYCIDGDKYRRVTHVIDSVVRRVQLERWRERVGAAQADIIKEETSEFGTLIHALTEAIDLGQTRKADAIINNNPHMMPYALEWEQWRQECVKKIIAIEVVVWSRKWRVAGRVDRIFIIRGDRSPSIWDLKTGTGLYDEMGIQVRGAYRTMYNQMYKDKVDRTGVIHMPREKFVGIKTKEYVGKEYEEKFKAILKLAK